MNYLIIVQYFLLHKSLLPTEALLAFFPSCTTTHSASTLPKQLNSWRDLVSLKATEDSNRSNNDGNNSEDFDGFSNDDIEAANDLAKQFYQQMKEREQLKGSANNDNNETWEIKNKKSSSIENDTRGKFQQPKEKRRKFTGRFNRGDLDSTGTPSAGLFATQNGTVYALPAPRRISIGSRTASSRSNNERLSPREQMMRREFNLVSLASNELTLILQGFLVMIILTFAIYIGATGGITDGSDRFGGGEGFINEYNGMGESLDFSSYMNDDASRISNDITDGMNENTDSSVWL